MMMSQAVGMTVSTKKATFKKTESGTSTPSSSQSSIPSMTVDKDGNVTGL